MRKVVVSCFSSVDGVAEGPDPSCTAWDDVVDEAGASVIATLDAVLVGRRGYDEWAEFWPGSEIEPFATFLDGVAKSRPGGDIGVHASISVAQTLLAAGLVDELGLAIPPVIVGSGRKLLDGLPSIRLEPIRGVTSPSGYLLVDDRVVE